MGVVYLISRVLPFVTLWTVACQVSLSMEFPRQEYWSGLPFPSLGDLPYPGVEPMSPALQADALPLSHLEIKGIQSIITFLYPQGPFYNMIIKYVQRITPNITTEPIRSILSKL